MTKALIRVLRRSLTTLLWLASILVIIFVLALSVIKLSLPYWTENKERMVALVEGQLGGEFDYATLEVDWSEFKPQVFFNDASWVSSDSTMRYHSGKTLVTLNFWESLLKGYVIAENIELNDVQADLNISHWWSDATRASFDLELFLKRYPEIINQEQIQVDNLAITLRKGSGVAQEETADHVREIQVETLTFEKLNSQRQLVVNLQSNFASQVSLVVESEGTPFKKDNSLKIYGLLTDFDVVDSADFFNLPQDIPVELADTEFWIEYQGNTPKSGRLLFNAASSDSQVAELDAEINFLRDQQLTIFSSDQFHIVERSESGDLTEYNSYFKVVRDAQSAQHIDWTLEAENTPIGYFVSLTRPFMPSDIRQKLLKIQPRGELVYLDIQAEQKEQRLVPKFGTAKLIDFSSSASDISPELFVNQLDIKDENNGWRVNLVSNDSSFSWPGIFKSPIPIDELQLNCWLNFEQRPLIEIEKFVLLNKDVELSSSGSIQLKEDDADLSLYAEAKNVNIAALENYWIRNEIDEDVLEFLDQALIAGQIDFARLVWRGDIEHFPYEDHSGQFDIQAKVSNSQFKFDQDWPLVTGLDATAHFKNNQLVLSATRGDVLGNPIKQADGVIEPLFTDGSILKLDVHNQVLYEPYRQLFQNSPLQQWLGEELLDLRFTGTLDNRLKLTVPLSEDGGDVNLDGTISLNGESFRLKQYKLGLDNLQGDLHYTGNGAHAKALKGTLWQSPIQVEIAVDDYTDNDDMINIDAYSAFDLAKAMASFDLQLPIRVEGSSPVNLHYRKDNEGSASLIVRSDLQGTQIEGPSWLRKSKDEDASFLATLYQKNGRIHSRTIYRDTVSAQLDFSEDLPSDINGVIALGDLATHSIEVPPSGVAIEGFFAEIHSNEWIDSLQVKKEGDFYWPQWIDHISVKSALFTVAGQSLHDVEFTDSLLADNSVRFNMSAREGFGNLTLYPDGRKHVTIEKLELELKPFSSLSDSEVNIDKASLDQWQLECLSCKINGIDTGKLTLVSQLENGAIVVKGDSSIEGQLSAYLEGRWQGQQSQVEVKFSTGDTGRLLQRWGYGDGVKDTPASGEVALQWPGGFHDITLKDLDGTVRLDTGEGAVKELSDRQARVFSLFSLQSVRRRLSLDFSDLFEDGFFYDKMKGAFTIKKGVIHSDDVFIDGTAADVRVKGSIDLVKQTVNQNVTVVPKLGSSLPILAGWALEPTTGLIMLLVNKIFEPVIDVVVSIEYKVTGDLSDPKVTELSKKSKEVVVPEEEIEEQTEELAPEEQQLEESEPEQ